MQLNKSKVIFLKAIICEKKFLLRAVLKLIFIAEALEFIFDPRWLSYTEAIYSTFFQNLPPGEPGISGRSGAATS